MWSSVSRAVGRVAGRRRTAACQMVVRRGVHVEKRLEEMGVVLPEVAETLGSYVPCVRSGNMVYTAGHLPFQDGSLLRGRVGQDVSVEEAQEAAKCVMINMLGSLKAELGDLDKVKRFVKLTGFVNCVSGFSGQPQVVNGASDFLFEVFQDKGVHARSAVGVNVLPLNAPVEIEAVVEVEEGA